eukprot:295125-Pelagomonas_calceolata.AAC.1
MEVQVKCGPKTYAASVAEGMTGAAFQEHLQELTGVFARWVHEDRQLQVPRPDHVFTCSKIDQAIWRHQKLIFKGKVIDVSKTLSRYAREVGPSFLMMCTN